MLTLYALSRRGNKVEVQIDVPGQVVDKFFSLEHPNIIFVNFVRNKQTRQLVVEYEGYIIQEIPHDANMYSIFIAEHEDNTLTYAAVLGSPDFLKKVDFQKLSIFPASHRTACTRNKYVKVALAAVCKLSDVRYRIAIASRIHLENRNYVVLEATPRGRLRLDFVTEKEAAKLRQEGRLVAPIGRVCEARLIDVYIVHDRFRDVETLLDEFAKREIVYVASYEENLRYLAPAEEVQVRPE